MWYEKWKQLRQLKVMNRFVTILARSVNLDMIEIARGQKAGTVIRTKQWKQELDHKVEELIPKFTYKEWLLILSIEFEYEKASSNKTEDVRINLRKFLKNHYKELYQIFNMEYYHQYQTKEKEEVYSVVLAQDAYLSDELIDVVVIHYKDGSRMGYNTKTGKRVVIENVILTNQTSVVTLVEQLPSKTNRIIKLIESFFFEE